ncbi:MAG: zinc-ribbon domain-containing protein [Chloroflexota bacterium]|nr:zinc-ribbon domain-containing protein [Chloroflexota bacterium]
MLRLPPASHAVDRSQVARRKLQKRAFNDIDRGALGGLIFNARRLHSLTQAEVAAAIGRDRPWLSDVETGKITFVPDDDIRALAHTLSLDAQQLTTTRDNARSPVAAGVVAFGRRLACQVCGHANPDDANFCSNCGTQVSADVECPACGRLNESPSNFCTNCGRPLRGQIELRARADV